MVAQLTVPELNDLLRGPSTRDAFSKTAEPHFAPSQTSYNSPAVLVVCFTSTRWLLEVSPQHVPICEALILRCPVRQTWATTWAISLPYLGRAPSGGPYDRVRDGHESGECLRLQIPALKMQDAAQGFRPTEPNTGGTTTAYPCLALS